MKRFRRKAPVKGPATIMIVVTEGKKTEPEYLKAFKEIHVQPYVDTSIFNFKTIFPDGTDPKTIVNRAVQELQKGLTYVGAQPVHH